MTTKQAMSAAALILTPFSSRDAKNAFGASSQADAIHKAALIIDQETGLPGLLAEIERLRILAQSRTRIGKVGQVVNVWPALDKGEK